MKKLRSVGKQNATFSPYFIQPGVHVHLLKIPCTCFSTIQVWMCDSCEKTEFGCCVDLENAALGPNFDGCPAKNGTGGGYKDCTLTVSLSIAAVKRFDF